jgi:peptidoglycan/LPS O-acetylase OafA/YrhL
MSGGRTIPYEPALDGLRGISVIAVMAFHAAATSGLIGWFRGGNLGVSVFFTLSGFLITTILVTEFERTGHIDLGRFWSRRIRRLAPAALVVLTLVIVVGAVTDWISVKRPSAVAAIWSATNWHVIAAGDDRLLETIVGPFGPTWSLAVEEQFYVVLAVVTWLAARSERPRRLLTIVFAAMIPMSVILANTVSDWHPRLEFGTDVRAAEIAIGGLLAIGWKQWHVQVARRAATADVIGIAGLGALFVLFMFADSTPPWLLRGGYSIVALVSASVIVGALAHRRSAAALGGSVIVAIGRASYSLYLVHWPIMLALTHDRVRADRWVLVGVKFLVAGIVGFALHILVEQPMRQRTTVAPRATIVRWLGASFAVTVLALALAD